MLSESQTFPFRETVACIERAWHDLTQRDITDSSDIGFPIWIRFLTVIFLSLFNPI